MKRIVLSIFASLQFISADAHQPYQAIAVVGESTAHVSDPNMVDLARSLSYQNLKQLLPFYTPISPIGFDINLRGISASAAFAADSTNLLMVIPQTGDVKVFAGETRDDSLVLFKDYIRDAGTHVHLLKAYAKYSPIDPIAGNPVSLLAQMGQSDYLLGRLSSLSGCSCSWSSQPITHQFQAGLNVGRTFSKAFDTTLVTVPLRYSYSPTGDWAFIIDAPITYNRNGGASSLFGSVGLGFRIPVFSIWSLTPVIRAGAGGSLDLCTSGCFISAGITSNLQYNWANFVWALTNYGGYYTSTNCWLTGVNFNYHLQNYVLKNGLSVTTCEGLTICDRTINCSLSFIDSYFPSGRLYVRHYDEFGISFFANGVNPYIDYDCLSLSFSYQFGQEDYTGYLLNLTYQF